MIIMNYYSATLSIIILELLGYEVQKRLSKRWEQVCQNLGRQNQWGRNCCYFRGRFLQKNEVNPWTCGSLDYMEI